MYDLKHILTEIINYLYVTAKTSKRQQVIIWFAALYKNACTYQTSKHASVAVRFFYKVEYKNKIMFCCVV